MIINFDSDCIEEYESLVAALDRGDVRFKPKKFDLDMKNRESPPQPLTSQTGGASKASFKFTPTQNSLLIKG